MIKPLKVLFVCMGNICRSPTAEGCFRKHLADYNLSDHFQVDSAGTISAHVGEPPDPRSCEMALDHGVDLSTTRARKITAGDFDYFDYIIAMDSDNIKRLNSMSNQNSAAQLSLLMQWDDTTQLSEVPDPYYGGHSGFEDVFTLLENTTLTLLKKLCIHNSIPNSI